MFQPCGRAIRVSTLPPPSTSAGSAVVSVESRLLAPTPTHMRAVAAQHVLDHCSILQRVPRESWREGNSTRIDGTAPELALDDFDAVISALDKEVCFGAIVCVLDVCHIRSIQCFAGRGG